MNFKKIQNLSAVLMVFAFFLPWISMGFISLSGYKVASLGGGATWFFLIPTLAIMVLVNDVQCFLDDKKTKYLTYTTAVIPMICIASVIWGSLMGDMEGVEEFFEWASIGIYLTFLASVSMLHGVMHGASA
tara:strand:- start:54 stop:446 length:393 start_codon:yes stop_codon:yes gene_type:complete